MRMNELNLPRSEIVRLTEEWVMVVRNKNIFYMKLDGYTYEEVAEEFNLSVQQTKVIVRDCLERIAKHIN